MAQLPPGTYAVEARCRGYEPATRTFTLTSGQQPTLIEMAMAPSEHCLVELGELDPGASVVLVNERGLRVTLTEHRRVADKLPPGEYTLSLSPHRDASAQRVTVDLEGPNRRLRVGVEGDAVRLEWIR